MHLPLQDYTSLRLIKNCCSRLGSWIRQLMRCKLASLMCSESSFRMKGNYKSSSWQSFNYLFIYQLKARYEEKQRVVLEILVKNMQLLILWLVQSNRLPPLYLQFFITVAKQNTMVIYTTMATQITTIRFTYLTRLGAPCNAQHWILYTQSLMRFTVFQTMVVVLLYD